VCVFQEHIEELEAQNQKLKKELKKRKEKEQTFNIELDEMRQDLSMYTQLYNVFVITDYVIIYVNIIICFPKAKMCVTFLVLLIYLRDIKIINTMIS